MFESLKELPENQLTGGVYYAVRLIRHIDRIKDARRGFWVKGVASEPNAEEREIGHRLVEEIEQAEGKPLIQIPKPNTSTLLTSVLVVYG